MACLKGKAMVKMNMDINIWTQVVQIVIWTDLGSLVTGGELQLGIEWCWVTGV